MLTIRRRIDLCIRVALTSSEGVAQATDLAEYAPGFFFKVFVTAIEVIDTGDAGLSIDDEDE
jgi:hypothetical protein